MTSAPGTILIADDDRGARHLLHRQLARRGFAVVEAADGVSALQRLTQAGAPPVAILDWEMPGLSGLELVRTLRRRDLRPRPYLILLTARTGVESVVEGIDAGADDFLTKPVDPRELRVRVNAAVRVVEYERALDGMIERYRTELGLARELQRSSLARDDSLAAVGARALYEPSAELGGDLYDLVRFADGAFGLLIADATGHGTRAALLAMQVKNAFAAAAPGDPDPAELLGAMNGVLTASLRDDGYAGALYLRFDAGGGAVRFASAGHYPPLVQRATGGRWHTIEAPGAGLYLGVERDYICRTDHVRTAPGDRLLVYTDGALPGGGGGRAAVDALTAALNDAPADADPLQVLRALPERDRDDRTIDDVCAVLVTIGAGAP